MPVFKEDFLLLAKVEAYAGSASGLQELVRHILLFSRGVGAVLGAYPEMVRLLSRTQGFCFA